jgi:hypothetical protein
MVPEFIDFNASKGIKLDYWNKQGYGYADSGFVLTEDKKNVMIKGNRYMYGGEVLPAFLPWIVENMQADPNVNEKVQEDMEIHAPNINMAFLEELGTENFSRRSFMKWERIMHSHGCSMREVDWIRRGVIPRCVDMVFYPSTDEHC